MTMARLTTLRLAALLAVALTVLLLPPSAAAATDKLPDLRMAALSEFRVQTASDGRRLLRFTSVIVNLGSGAFHVYGNRTCTTTSCPSTINARQLIFNDAGSFRTRATDAIARYSGDGHDHWHVERIASFELIPQDAGAPPTSHRWGSKIGFCFFDTTAYRLSTPGAPQQAKYRSTGCGVRSSTKITMGISVGWGDKYGWSLAYQWIDITGVPSGRYRVCATADPKDWFLETNNVNNHVWQDLQITSTGVTVGARAWSACRP